MAQLLDPARISSRTGWGAALTVGVGALLPAALGSAQALVPASASRVPRLAQDAVLARFGAVGAGGAVVAGRGRLRLVPGPLPAVAAAWPVSVPASAAPAPPVDAGPCGEAGWFSPAPGAAISQVFGVPDTEYAAGYHTGVDFAVFTGTPLLAVADAVVEVAGWGGAYGNWIVLRLPDGHFALYAHMSHLDVHTGDHVDAGQRLGLSGESGHARGPHLHFEIRTQNHYGAVVDPLPYLRSHGCRF
ncbi:M23 family metallopeptidase [Streptacidiphilus jiangxiensis]|uniref:Murein DD-endopeptidase MepM and murein hydrolase activator NlpD, contain LysM domain n=1 Tax=Streptacidiphilus jiangxiensis TaxID=235985 RepID=A0A1H7JW17_STRJI|nr:M23 family metallopeptidase [Streptacidiphilus jiangxiensis]SEK78769.1 Murein DD-endopeptidase MepM and murein hydrolase activator NlpD, contain LysM domain [Streptacidiphilus jiangxiensis]